MNNVFKRAQSKRLDHQVKNPAHTVCEQSRQHSQQLMARFEEVVNHYAAEEDVDVNACKQKLQELHQHHHQCFRNQRLTGPNER